MSIASILAFFFVYYLLAGLAVNLGYHRVLSHRSLKLPTWLERTLVSSDFRRAPPSSGWATTVITTHIPILRSIPIRPCNVASGMPTSVGISDRTTYFCAFSIAVAGPLRMLVDAWMRPRTNQEFNALAPDVSRGPLVPAYQPPWPYAAPCTCIFWFLGVGGLVPLGNSWVAVVWLTFAALYNMGDAIDSVSHMFGNRALRAAGPFPQQFCHGVADSRRRMARKPSSFSLECEARSGERRVRLDLAGDSRSSRGWTCSRYSRPNCA